ncbi:MAG: hypothetical protein ACFFCQ_06155 [Promethearchaeota archaeon]
MDLYEGPMSLYYLLHCYIMPTAENLTYDDLDASLSSTAEELTQDFRGEARSFTLELEDFSSEDRIAAVILKFTYYPYEDDEDELELIIKGVITKFESIGLEVEDIESIGAI